MNRVEELTLDLLDGVLDDTGRLELERLLAEDEAARHVHFAMCQQEAALRGRGTTYDVLVGTMDQIRRALMEQDPRGESAAKVSAVNPPPGTSTNREFRIAPPPPPPGSVDADPEQDRLALGPANALVGDGQVLASPPPPPVSGVQRDAHSLESTQPTVDFQSPLYAAATPDEGMAQTMSFWPDEPFVKEQVAGAEPTISAVSPATVSPDPEPAWTAFGLPPPDDSPIESDTIPTIDDSEEVPAGWGRTLVGSLASMFIHLVGMIVLGVWIVPHRDEAQTLTALATFTPREDELERELETVFLDESLRPATEIAFTSTATLQPDAATWSPKDAAGAPDLLHSLVATDSELLRTADDRFRDLAFSKKDLMTELDPGTSGKVREVVDSYQQALDRITQEILTMLEKGDVLVVWCFDQSESMKDDQQEIRARLDRVYAELGALGVTGSDALTTAITSFGQGFALHTKEPTTDLGEITSAIDAIPVDPSGEEMMCNAVMRSIAEHRNYARAQNRQMAVILVSDESGNPEESDAYLEPAVAQAVAAGCRIYVLGREAVFGYPLAHVRWVHPETNREHLLPVDRGPETAMVEQLQTEGFKARTDAHPSGFGPYAQSRLAWQTGGIFFMLPSLESNLHRGEKRRYSLAAMEAYKPDLRSRPQVLADLQRSRFRSLIFQVINDLNPYDSRVKNWMNLPQSFPSDFNLFARQARDAHSKAGLYLAGLTRSVEALQAARPQRDREPLMRWKANYDLLLAQVVAYCARVHLYRNALEAALAKLPQTPPTKDGNKRLVSWRVRRDRSLPVDDLAGQTLQQGRELYLTVIENHPGTPWAARARWELERDFDYTDPDPETTEALAYAGHEATGNGVAERTASKSGPDGATANDAATGGGGGGGSGGGGADGTEWGIDRYPGFELVPEYRTPPKPAGPGSGSPPGRARPRTTSPIPKL